MCQYKKNEQLPISKILKVDLVVSPYFVLESLLEIMNFFSLITVIINYLRIKVHLMLTLGKSLLLNLIKKMIMKIF